MELKSAEELLIIYLYCLLLLLLESKLDTKIKQKPVNVRVSFVRSLVYIW